MLSFGIIVFREVLEIALILGVVLVATRGLALRGRWTLAGIGAGIMGSVVVALSAGAIADAVAGMGQEFFDATILLTAALLIGWTVVWMKRHSEGLARKIKEIGRNVAEGRRPLYVIAVVVALAVLREGSEIVLLSYGVLVTGGTVFQLVTGGLVGLALGALVGGAIYFGLIRVATKYVFSVTGIMLMFIAAGMVSQAVAIMGTTGFIPVWVTPMWDTSSVLSEGSAVGSVLSTLVGYSAQPSLIQFISYVLTLGTLTLLLRLYGSRRRGPSAAPVSIKSGVSTAVLLLAVVTVAVPWNSAHAIKKVYSPLVEHRELELEARGGYDIDENSEFEGVNKQKYAVGYGPFERFFFEVYGEIEKSGTDYELEAIELEGRYQVFELGERWLELGGYLSYELALEDGHADKFEAKILLEKSTGPLTHMTNLIAEREVGTFASGETEAEFSWSSRYRWKRTLEPGVELHSGFGEFGNFASFNEQTQLLGPVIYGKLGRFKYDVGYLFGITDATQDGMVKWNLEYEFLL